MGGKRAAFWLGVAGVSILAQFGLELIAEKAPSQGLRQLAAFVHRGGPQS